MGERSVCHQASLIKGGVGDGFRRIAFQVSPGKRLQHHPHRAAAANGFETVRVVGDRGGLLHFFVDRIDVASRDVDRVDVLA